MPNLSIDLTAEMVPGLISALESYRESSEGAESVLFAALYDRRSTLIDYAADLSALRDIERAALSRDLTDTEDAILHKLRGSACHWIHNKAGQILAEIARNPLVDRAMAHDTEPDTRPGQDAGEALIGVECYVWWTDKGFGIRPTNPVLVTVDSVFNANDPKATFYQGRDASGENRSGNNARPVYLGRPTA